MSERVNQIRYRVKSARIFAEHSDSPAVGLVLSDLADVAEIHADLLTRLEDGSAYDIGAKASFEQRHPDGKWNRMPRMSKRQWRRTFKTGLDAALGLQEDD